MNSAFVHPNAVGVERHWVFDCPHFQDVQQQPTELLIFHAVRCLMSHTDQKSVCSLVVAIVKQAQAAWQICPHLQIFAGSMDIFPPPARFWPGLTPPFRMHH